MSSSSYPEELHYTKNHEWLLVEENLVTFGLTPYAVEFLGEILYLDLPEDGQHASLGQVLGNIESIRKIHDLVSTLDGTVLEVNSAILENPSTINDDPFGDGWLLRLEMDNERDLAGLLRSKDYRALVESIK